MTPLATQGKPPFVSWSVITTVLLLLLPVFVRSSPSPSSSNLDSRYQHSFGAPQTYDDDGVISAYQRVNVTLGVMSRCPDALACEAVFDKVLERVNAKTRLTMSYIGTPTKNRHDHKYGVECKHGDSECAGNVQQLCVQEALSPQRAGDEYDLSPSAAQRKWWNFIQCQNYAGLANVGDEALAQRCLKLIDGPGWERDGIASCIHGKHGRKLLQQSVLSSHNHNISLSCTIQIEGRTRCIRDGASWKDCEMGHEVSDFVAEIERLWSKKNQGHDFVAKTTPSSSTKLSKRQSSASPSGSISSGSIFSGSGTPPSVFRRIFPRLLQEMRQSSTLLKRQSSGGNDSNLFQGPNFPVPFLAFAITAIALFVIVVCFVLLRIIVRNRRLRRLGLLHEGPLDRLLGPSREIEDTLVPPKLMEARIAHGFRPPSYDADPKSKGWDAVMPISAALPPNIYSELFPNDLRSKDKHTQQGGNDFTTAGAPVATDFSYPPAATQSGNQGRLRVHVPSFLRRTDHTGNESNAGFGTGDGQGDDADPKKLSNSEESAPASVNITVLIAMPSHRTVFPTAKSLRRSSFAVKTQPSVNLRSVASQKLQEVDELADEDRKSLRRTASIKSFRTAASAKSLAEARRDAFFNSLANETQRAEALPTGDDEDVIDHHHVYDDDEELPELVFGTASVPIFSRSQTTMSSQRQAFVGASEAFHPVRAELIELVRSAQEAKERKARNESTAKATDKEGGSGDDGQTTLDERSTNQFNAGRSTGTGNAVHAPRDSASETIDSEAGAAIGNSSRQEGLGDVVGRMMMPNSANSTDHPNATVSEVPQPSTAFGSNPSQDEAAHR